MFQPIDGAAVHLCAVLTVEQGVRWCVCLNDRDATLLPPIRWGSVSSLTCEGDITVIIRLISDVKIFSEAIKVPELPRPHPPAL